MSLKKFYADPYYQIRSFAVSASLAAAACALLYWLRPPEFYAFHATGWHLLLIPLGIYLGGLSAVFIHNATHQSFPNRWLGDLCGSIAGLHQLWGYRGWKLIHLIHHQYSDHTEWDPHPTKGETFWRYTKKMFVRSSRTISRRYREHWSDSARTRTLQRVTVALFFAMAGLFLLFWFLLLGPAAFVFGYVPSYIANHLLFAHINFFCHPLDEESGETKAANLTHGWYYPLANALWHGIYFHGNHHRKPNYFNPRKLKLAHAQTH